MIRPAYIHREALQTAHQTALCDPRCAYYTSTSWAKWKLEVDETEWNTLQRASVDGDRVVGFLAAGIDRDIRAVDHLEAICYRPGSLVWARDFAAFFHMLVTGGYTRIGWRVTIGNPAEAIYDRVVEELGGRVAGRLHRIARTRDGVVRDQKLYEVLPDEVRPEGLARLARFAGVRRAAL